MATFRALILLSAMPLTSGCVAKTLVDVATAPVRVVGKGVDLATTSQSEADEKRGRALRKREEALGRLERSHERNRRDCAEGDRKACERADEDYAAIQDLLARD